MKGFFGNKFSLLIGFEYEFPYNGSTGFFGSLWSATFWFSNSFNEI